MITLSEARRFYPPNQVPPDRELERLLAAMYAIASREWDVMTEEKGAP